MIGFFHAVRQVFNGTRSIDDKSKYRAIGIGIALIHLFFMAAFWYLHIMLLAIYNMAVTVFYLYLSLIAIRKERYFAIFISALVEILLHSSLASILLGWNWGFMLYTMALIPVAFYLAYTLPYFEGGVFSPIAASAVVGLCYIVIRAVTGQIEPVYDGKLPENVDTFFYYFNTMVALGMQLVCSVLFALEIRFMRRRLEKENHRLGEIANYDPLTHLLNRRSMNVHLKNMMEHTVSEQREFCLVLLDIDDFKKVNDTHGHACGDEVLIAVANVISNDIREGDSVCRWGGEEILILLQADLQATIQVAERICRDIASNIVHCENTDISVTVTMGIADYQEGKTVRSMIDEADRNLYCGKKNGKNQVVSSANA